MSQGLCLMTFIHYLRTKVLNTLFYFCKSILYFRYLDSCQLIGGTAQPMLDECAQELESTCNSFVQEECTYAGTDIFHKSSVTDAHSCQEILVTLGEVLGGDYFVFDSDTSICTFFDSREFTCSSLSGPVMPSFDECQSGASTTQGPVGSTTAPTMPSSSAPTTMPATSSSPAPTVGSSPSSSAL